MVTDHQVRLLFRLILKERTFALAAAKAGMDSKTARKYRQARRLPSEMKVEHDWRTRQDSFEEVWEEVEVMLQASAGLEAKTLFEYLQRKYPGRFQDGQLRTLQRRVKTWRALEGPGKEVFFPQRHHPGVLAQSDFTDLGKLGITLAGAPFAHLLYHFVLTYSNWESGTICFGENFESLSEGLQNALWELGGTPQAHQTDRLSTAVNNLSKKKEFTDRYGALLKHYGLEGRKTQAAHPNENGDIEQSHHRLQRAIEQELLLRGSRDFADRREYEVFLQDLLRRRNAGRRRRLQEELQVLRELPSGRLDAGKRVKVRVGPSSAVHVQHNTYSVHSRLIGETLEMRLYAEHLEVWYAQRCIEKIPRLRGEGKVRIHYRHIIDWLVRKPGAFENYRYREELFPSSTFRMAYDALKANREKKGSKEYLQLLELAAKESESRVEDALRWLLAQGERFSFEQVKALVLSAQQLPAPTEISIDEVDLAKYDELLNPQEEQSSANSSRECEGGADGVFEGVTVGDGPAVLRAGGQAGPAGIVEL